LEGSAGASPALSRASRDSSAEVNVQHPIKSGAKSPHSKVPPLRRDEIQCDNETICNSAMMIAPKTANKTDAQKIAEKIACANMILRPQFGQSAALRET
jgi:hypothetical protein